jgi:uracil-DNA glycosylase
MIPDLPDPWKTLIGAETKKDYFKQLILDIEASYLINNPPIYPPAELVYNALELCAPKKTKVVILGQDPYHGKDQAMGLAFSVLGGTKIPPSLMNIFKELKSDVGMPIPQSGNLSHWANQGVLLLNATLTVEAENAGSHQGKGWEQFTDHIIKTISAKQQHVVFILWGNYAQAKSNLIDESKHLILTAPHPSPLSAHRGFFGSKHFSQTNEYLQQHKITPIEW